MRREKSINDIERQIQRLRSYGSNLRVIRAVNRAKEYQYNIAKHLQDGGHQVYDSKFNYLNHAANKKMPKVIYAQMAKASGGRG